MPNLPDLPDDPSVLPPPEPRDKPGTRPKLDLAVVVRQVRAIQEGLARERAEKAEKAAEAGAREAKNKTKKGEEINASDS